MNIWEPLVVKFRCVCSCTRPIEGPAVPARVATRSALRIGSQRLGRNGALNPAEGSA